MAGPADLDLELLEARAQLRPEVEDLAGVAIPAAMWEILVGEYGLDSHASDGDWVDELVDRVKHQERVRRARLAARGPEPVEVSEVAVRRSDPQRFDALSVILALEADLDPEVDDWRARFLAEGVVAPEQVDEVVGRLHDVAGDRRPLRDIALEIGEVLAEHRERLVAARETDEALAAVLDHARQLADAAAATTPQAKLRFTFRRADGRLASRPVPPDGPLAELVAIGERLSRGYNWRLLDAVMFILTGTPPPVRPVVATVRATDRAATSRIRLEVDPRTPHGEVKRAYEEARRDPILVRRLRRHVRSSRGQLADSTCELATFVARRPDSTWSELCEAWNSAHLKREYPGGGWRFSDPAAFATAAKRAWRSVVGTKLSKSEKAMRAADAHMSAQWGLPPGALSSLPYLPED